MKPKMSSALLIAGLLVAGNAYAATAFFTGRSKYVTTATYKQGISCEYDYMGEKFWRTFAQSQCPLSVEVE